jgi:hypothetical protein
MKDSSEMHESDCAVSPDGGSISLALPNKDGKRCEVVLTFDEASSLAMTLPRLLKMALRRRYSDRALRHVYPLLDYGVECASDLRHLLLTLTANGGFDIVFAVSLETAAAIARDVAINRRLLIEAQPCLPH